jgi:hypothetical protein
LDIYKWKKNECHEGEVSIKRLYEIMGLPERSYSILGDSWTKPTGEDKKLAHKPKFLRI